MINVTAATMALEKRGPDHQDIYHDQFVGLGFRRLAIIDTSEAGNQPMWDDEKRFCIVFNGEIFNFKDLRRELESKGISFHSRSDTEVLLKLYIQEKENCLPKLNGFFAFCIYDKVEQTFFLARDRYGIKPLVYAFDEDKFLFASEIKSLLHYGIQKELDHESLFTYLQLNYIPAPYTIFKGVQKLLPGHYANVSRGNLELNSYYDLPTNEDPLISYESAKTKFKSLLEESVQKRLIADVPLGAFLSGGIDSSIVTALASKYKPNLHTFSIGFKDEPFFDETNYAHLVAQHFKTEHTVFHLTNDDLYGHLHSILDYLDEPFADSSAIAVYILSKETRKHATVALSGDGADELLGGYNKHAAHLRVIERGMRENMVGSLRNVWKILPKSRNSALTNKFRQLHRFAEGLQLSSQERYWRWAGFAQEKEVMNLIHPGIQSLFSQDGYHSRKRAFTRWIPETESMNDVLRNDMHLVLPNDMLTKVDWMSMANGLEVRVPFLDYSLVNFTFSLPGDFKINKSIHKRIAQDTFREVLPTELYNRPKKGFEVPLLKWFRKEMKSLIHDDLLSERFVTEQNILNYSEVAKLKKQLYSGNPGDVHARIWGLIVFQWWWKKYFLNKSA